MSVKKPARRLYKVVARTCLHCFLLQERSMHHPSDMYAMRTHTTGPVHVRNAHIARVMFPLVSVCAYMHA